MGYSREKVMEKLLAMLKGTSEEHPLKCDLALEIELYPTGETDTIYIDYCYSVQEKWRISSNEEIVDDKVYFHNEYGGYDIDADELKAKDINELYQDLKRQEKLKK